MLCGDTMQRSLGKRDQQTHFALDKTSRFREGNSNDIFAPVSAGTQRQRPHRLDAAAHLCPLACACRSARGLWRAARAIADAARTPWPAFSSRKYVLEYCTYVQDSQ